MPPSNVASHALEPEPWRTPASSYACGTYLCAGDEAAKPFPTELQVDWSTAVFRLERKGCYGTCPEYRVSLYPDGRVEYEGKEFVSACGREVGHVSGADRARLVAAFESANYLTADLIHDGVHRVSVTDQDTAITIVELSGHRRVVSHYGPRYYGPRLTVLERLMDEVIGTKRWTACPKRECFCTQPGAGERKFIDGLVGNSTPN